MRSPRASAARSYWPSPIRPASPGIAAPTADPWTATAARGAYAVRTYVVTAAGDKSVPRISTSLPSSSFAIKSPPASQAAKLASDRVSARAGRRAPNHTTYVRASHQKHRALSAARATWAPATPARPSPPDTGAAVSGRVGDCLAVGDEQPERLGRAAPDRGDVAGEPVEHLPRAEQRGSQPPDQERRNE